MAVNHSGELQAVEAGLTDHRMFIKKAGSVGFHAPVPEAHALAGRVDYVEGL